MSLSHGLLIKVLYVGCSALRRLYNTPIPHTLVSAAHTTQRNIFEVMEFGVTLRRIVVRTEIDIRGGKK